MKQIIDGKMYNTDTAEPIHYWDNGCGRSDFKFRSKRLYKTKKGSLFIEHDGGAMTDMAVSAGSNSVTGSSKIEPVTEKDAFNFLCSHGGTEKAEKLFPNMIEEA